MVGRMKQRPATHRRSGGASTSKASDSGPTLPAWKAFVVQFSREAGAGSGIFSGRVEHLSSGRRAHFASPEDLLAILKELLDELGEAGDRN
jgi:hypothetical protein